MREEKSGCKPTLYEQSICYFSFEVSAHIFLHTKEFIIILGQTKSV